MLQPFGNRLLVEQSKKEDSTTIFLVEDTKNLLRLPKGIVLGIGKSKDVIESGLGEGDVVHFNMYAGERIKEGEKEYLLLNLSDILAKEI